MNIVDLILAFGLFWTARKGWQIGLIQSLLSLLGIVLAYGFALTYGESAARRLFNTAEELDGGSALVGFLVIFALALLGCYVLGRMIHKALQASPLGIADAVGGSALGLAKGLLVFGLLTFLFRAYPIHSRVPELVDNSFLGAPVQKGALIIAKGVQSVSRRAGAMLQSLGVKPEKAPPLVEKLNKSAEDARKKIEDLIDESKKQLESK